MARFSYIARSRGGERVEGTIDAADRRVAATLLERQGLVPVSVKDAAAEAAAKASPKAPAKPGAAAPADAKTPAAKPVSRPAPKPPVSKAAAKPGAKPGAKKTGLRFEFKSHGGPRMPASEVLLFTRELSDLLTAGMTLGTALHTMSKRESHASADAIITSLRDDIVQGTSLSDALAKWPRTFPALYVSIVRAGEVSGQLSKSLERLCRHFERTQAAREKVVSALVYPAIVLLATVLTVIFALVYVVPKFQLVFKSLGGALPLSMQVLIGTSHLFVHYGWALLLLLGLSIYGTRRWLRTPEGKRKWHRWQLKVPVVKKIYAASAYANFAQTLGALLANGVPVLQALSIAEETSGNCVIAEAVHSARERVTDGATISSPLAAAGAFPPMLTDMLAVGEQTGDMPGALEHIARRYDGELDRAIRVFTTVLEPILILLMAVVVGFIAISMLSAVFDLTSGLRV